MDVRLALEKLSQQASSYTVVLNGRVSRDITRRPLTGDSADVYEGTLIPDGTKIAVKTIHADPPSSQESIKRVLREVCTWSKLCHENIQPFLGITTDFGFTVSMVSTWRKKGNAFDYVQDDFVDPRPLLVGIAKGLHYLHSHEPGAICHGDLRGCNVLISDDGQALLIDFGFSPLVHSSFTLPVGTHSMVSINWIAPESLEDFKPTVEGDIWAYGMTALELFTRKPPFYDINTIPRLITRIMSDAPDRPTEESTISRLTDVWWAICTSCWNRTPGARPSISEIATRIRSASAT